MNLVISDPWYYPVPPFLMWLGTVVIIFAFLWWLSGLVIRRSEPAAEPDYAREPARWAAFTDTMGMRVWIDADAVERVHEEPADVQVTIINMQMDWVRVRGTCEETLATLDDAT